MTPVQEVPPALEPLIVEVRRHRVILDADLARLYGVRTKRFNESFKRNRRRFPSDFAFQLSAAEFLRLRTEFSAASMNWSQFATSSASRRGKAYRPWAFTEHGALMAANILRSERANRMSVFVIRAFVRLRDGLAADSAILRRLAEIDRTLLQHDSALRDIYQKLLPLLKPPANPPKRGIGFHRIE
jgi:ORF6N domain-containing protein